MKHARFVHLHVHTQYSLLDGAIRLQSLVEQAAAFRMPAVAVTDHGNIFGAIEFYEKASAGGVKPIIGCEMYVAPRDRRDKTHSPGEDIAYHLILLAKNIQGYRNLCKLLTKAYLEGFYYKPRVDKELLRAHSEGLIALSACLQGEIPRLVSSGRFNDALRVAEEYREIFPDRRFFLELQDNGIAEQKKVNQALVEIARATGIPLVATNDCHYLTREDSRVHDILLCIQTGKTVNSPQRMRFETDQFYLKSPEEMIELFRDVPEAIENTVEIAERCNLELELNRTHLPDFPLPEGETVETLLERKAAEGLEKRLKRMGKEGEEKKWVYYERLKKELDVIKKTGFSGYFLIVSDFIEEAKRQGIPVGPGRGSAAGSLVAYALGITNLDPIRYNLLFERFLNPERISLPDIDIDFCFEGRDDIIRYVTEKYGKDNVTQIITFGQMKARAVIRDVGRALDMSYQEVDKIAKLIPPRLNITIKEALKEEPRLKELSEKDRRVAELINIAIALEGLPRHASTHAAGVVISQKPLVEYLPLYKGQKENIVTTQFQMKDIEKIGLVKFDFLGVKTLTVIDRAVKEVERNKGKKLDIDNIPLDDEKTYRLLSAANTNGIFQLESSGIKELLKKLKPEKFEDLIATVALYRPGPLQSGMVDEFIKRKHGKEPVRYELPQLEDILKTTYGVMVYQEQVMEIAKVLAGFTPGEADVLRKAMGKKVPEVMLEQRERFLKGCKEKGIPMDKAEKIFDLMAKFAGYGFNKSHSAAYALIAYQTAYLKAHYPAEFMSALLSANMGDTDKIVKYIADCRDMGIQVLPPDINHSSMDFTVSGDTIRFGLQAVKNVGASAIEEILRARGEGGPFTSLEDFLERVDSRRVNRKVTESLIKCGAFDFTGKNRGVLMAELVLLSETLSRRQEAELLQNSLFDGMTQPVARRVVVDEAECSWDRHTILANEKEALGFYITHHPLEDLTEEMALYSTDTTETLKERAIGEGEEVSILCIITARREVTTRKGSKMAFLTVEDLKGSLEVIVFSELYSKIIDRIGEDTPLVITGKVERDREKEEVVKLIASDVMTLEEAKNKLPPKTHIIAQKSAIEESHIHTLKKMILSHPGKSQVFLHLRGDDRRESILMLPDNLRIEPSREVLEEIKGSLSGCEIRITHGRKSRCSIKI